MKFGKKEKLSPRYIGPYVILERVREHAYRLDLLLELSQKDNVFHICILRKCVPDSSLVI